MSNPYSQPTLTGYNSNPPPDDGSQVASNAAEWTVQIIGKVGGPLKDFIQSVDTNVLAAFGKIFGANITTQNGTYSLQTSDQGKFIEFTATATLNLLAADTAGTGFCIAVVNTGSSATVTIDGSGSETINGSTTLVLADDEAAILTCNGTKWIAVVSQITSSASTTAEGIVELATQAEMESETAGKVPTADIINHNPGVAKVWAQVTDSGTAALAGSGRNVSSVDDDATGNYGVNLTTSFSDTNYAAIASAAVDANQVAIPDTLNTGSIEITRTGASGGAASDGSFCVAAFGDQA